MHLELRGITKRFGTFTANDSIDMVVEPGQIHAILGENGAGKSTLMNTLYGLYTPEEGEIVIDGVPHVFTGPGDAMNAGIGMVHQHFMLVPVFTVAENIVLGHEPVGRGLIDLKSARAMVRDTAALPVDYLGDPLFYVDPSGVRYSLAGLRLIDTRANLLRTTSLLSDVALDKYTFVRDAHLQYRRAAVGVGPDSGAGKLESGRAWVNDLTRRSGESGPAASDDREAGKEPDYSQDEPGSSPYDTNPGDAGKAPDYTQPGDAGKAPDYTQPEDNAK